METWPVDVLTPRDCGFWPVTPAIHGPPSLAGVRQVLAGDAGIWGARYESVALNRPDKILAARGFLYGHMQGPVTPVNVPVIDCHHTPKRRFEVRHRLSRSVFENLTQTTFFTLFADVAVRDTQFQITLEPITGWGDARLELEPGQYFTFRQRLYIVESVTVIAEFRRQLRVWPPLRLAAVAGAILDAETPYCPMRMVGEVPQIMLQLLRLGRATVEFNETEPTE